MKKCLTNFFRIENIAFSIEVESLDDYWKDSDNAHFSSVRVSLTRKKTNSVYQTRFFSDALRNPLWEIGDVLWKVFLRKIKDLSFTELRYFLLLFQKMQVYEIQKTQTETRK